MKITILTRICEGLCHNYYSRKPKPPLGYGSFHSAIQLIRRLLRNHQSGSIRESNSPIGIESINCATSATRGVELMLLISKLHTATKVTIKWTEILDWTILVDEELYCFSMN